MFTIGKLAGQTGVSNDTLRYYEQEGLIQPAAKSPAGYRLYDRDSVRHIHFIKHAQSCGFTLAEIRELLAVRGRDKACCGGSNFVLVEGAGHMIRVEQPGVFFARLDRFFSDHLPATAAA
jgi:DNA-binding transcriptional MerR regulator